MSDDLPANAVYLDVEASSLGPHGFPVEVAVASVATVEVCSWLIKPSRLWIERGTWDDDAEALKVQRQSRHKSLDTLLGYVRTVDQFKEHVGLQFCEGYERSNPTARRHDRGRVPGLGSA